MPSTDDIRKRQEARQLRKLAQQGHVEQAHSEAIQQGAQSEANEAAKTVADPSNVGQQPRVNKASPKAAKQARQAQAKRAAEHQALRDTERSPEPVNVEAELVRWDGVGSPPLHLLNAVAQRLDAETRDEGRDIASAAAKGAYDTFIGKSAMKRDRHSHMRAQIAAGEAQVAAAAKASDNT